MFYESHPGKTRQIERRSVIEIIIFTDLENFPAPALHALEDHKIVCDMLVNQIESQKRVPQVIEDTHKDDQIEALLKSRHIPHRHAKKLDLNLFHLCGKSSLLQIVLIRIDSQNTFGAPPLHFERVEAGVAAYIENRLASQICRNRILESSKFDPRIIAQEMIRSCFDTMDPEIVEPRAKGAYLIGEALFHRRILLHQGHNYNVP
jgi:hypothetical protein